MTLDQASAVSEIVSSITVVLSLVYLGYQVKQNTTATSRLSTTHDIAQGFREQYLMVAGDNVANVWVKGMSDLDSLDASEALQFFASLHNVFRIYENALYQYASGALEPALWKGMEQQFIDLSTLPGVRQYWAMRKNYFSTQLQQRFDGHIASSAAKPIHHLAGITR